MSKVLDSTLRRFIDQKEKACADWIHLFGATSALALDLEDEISLLKELQGFREKNPEVQYRDLPAPLQGYATKEPRMSNELMFHLKNGKATQKTSR